MWRLSRCFCNHQADIALAFLSPPIWLLQCCWARSIRCPPTADRNCSILGALCASWSQPNSSASCCNVAQGFVWHGPVRLRTFRADVPIEAVDGPEAVLTPSRPWYRSNVNKQGERASGVIRPKEGGSLPSIATICTAYRLCSRAFEQVQSKFCVLLESIVVHFVHWCLFCARY